VITVRTRASLANRLRTAGTLTAEPQLDVITRVEASHPLVQRVDRLLRDEDTHGTPWLVPSHLQQVLP